VTYSAPLLMRSGVKLPALGEGFRAHPGTPVFGVYDEPVNMNTGATQGWATTRFREEPGFKLETLSLPLDMQAGRLAGGGAELMQRLGEFSHIAMWVQATRAESVGRIRPAFGGKSNIYYTLKRPDMERFVAGMAAVARMHFAAGARKVLPGIFGLPYSIGPDEVHLIESAPRDPRAYVSILSHLFGGCTMGRDASRSVADPRGRVHGHPGLYVVDASVFPTNLGVNPQHTIMAVARHFAELALDASPARPGSSHAPPRLAATG
jgi:choline dehydrogenase-like flavoprotein